VIFWLILWFVGGCFYALSGNEPKAKQLMWVHVSTEQKVKTTDDGLFVVFIGVLVWCWLGSFVFILGLWCSLISLPKGFFPSR